MVEARSPAEIRIDLPNDWLDAPPLETAPEPLPDPEAIFRAAGGVIEAPPRLHGRLRVQTVAEILNAPPRAYLLQGLFAVAEFIVLWGAPKSGKSFLALRLAYGLALGRGMWNRKAPRPLRVLYVAAEGAGGMGARLQALREALGDDEGRFAVIAQPAEIGPPGKDAEALREAAKAHAADLVIIDTLARTFGKGNEDATQDMGQFVAECDVMRLATGAAVLVVHHGSKAEGAKTPRGSGALMGAADLIFQVKKGAAGSPSVAIVQAAKDDEEGAEMPFRLEVVTVGEREDGTPLETCIAEEAETGWGKRNAQSLTGKAGQAVKVLSDTVAAEGQELPREKGFPSASGMRGVPKKRWREECITRGICVSDSPDSARRVAERAMEAAIKAGAVACRGDLVWLVRND